MMKLVMHGKYFQAIISLEPTVNGAPMDGDTPTFPTVTLAEVFIKYPLKAWLSTGVPQLKTGVSFTKFPDLGTCLIGAQA